MNKVVCTFLALPVLASALLAAQPQRPLTEADLRSSAGDITSGDTPRTALPEGPQVAPLATPKPPKPRTQRQPEAGGEKKKTGPTEITAREGLFDQKAHQAIFSNDVLVVNPEFRLVCDKLTAFLRNDDAKAEPNAAPAPKKDKAGGLERVVAEGSVVITQEKVDEGGAVTKNIGRAKKAVYEASTGDMTLTGKPEVQTGINSCVALDESTVMVLNRDGRMKVFGPHKTVIKDTSAPEVQNAR